MDDLTGCSACGSRKHFVAYGERPGSECVTYLRERIERLEAIPVRRCETWFIADGSYRNCRYPAGHATDHEPDMEATPGSRYTQASVSAPTACDHSIVAFELWRRLSVVVGDTGEKFAARTWNYSDWIEAARCKACGLGMETKG